MNISSETFYKPRHEVKEVVEVNESDEEELHTYKVHISMYSKCDKLLDERTITYEDSTVVFCDDASQLNLESLDEKTSTKPFFLYANKAGKTFKINPVKDANIARFNPIMKMKNLESYDINDLSTISIASFLSGIIFGIAVVRNF